MGKGSRNRAKRVEWLRTQPATTFAKRGQHISDRIIIDFDDEDSAPSLADYDRVVDAVTNGKYIPRDMTRKMTEADLKIMGEFDEIYAEAVEQFGSDRVLVTGDGNYPKTLHLYIVETEGLKGI
jgi:hypothetical protein